MKRKVLSVLSIAALIFASAGVSLAQNAAPAADAPAADAPAKPDAPKVAEKSIADMWRAGGITMYPLGFFAIQLHSNPQKEVLKSRRSKKS